MASLIKTILGSIAGAALLFAALHYVAGGYVAPLSADQAPQSVPVVSDTKLVGSRAPYFDLPDLAGNHRALSDFNNEPLVVVFFTTWNQQAADEIKILDDYLTVHSDDAASAQIVAIDTQEEKSVISTFMSRGGYRVQTLIDTSGSIAESYRIKSVPTTYFIDPSGIVRGAYIGLMNQDTIGRNIEAILK